MQVTQKLKDVQGIAVDDKGVYYGEGFLSGNHGGSLWFVPRSSP